MFAVISALLQLCKLFKFVLLRFQLTKVHWLHCLAIALLSEIIIHWSSSYLRWLTVFLTLLSNGVLMDSSCCNCGNWRELTVDESACWVSFHFPYPGIFGIRHDEHHWLLFASLAKWLVSERNVSCVFTWHCKSREFSRMSVFFNILNRKFCGNSKRIVLFRNAAKRCSLSKLCPGKRTVDVYAVCQGNLARHRRR